MALYVALFKTFKPHLGGMNQAGISLLCFHRRVSLFVQFPSEALKVLLCFCKIISFVYIINSEFCAVYSGFI